MHSESPPTRCHTSTTTVSRFVGRFSRPSLLWLAMLVLFLTWGHLTAAENELRPARPEFCEHNAIQSSTRNGEPPVATTVMMDGRVLSANTQTQAKQKPQQDGDVAALSEATLSLSSDKRTSDLSSVSTAPTDIPWQPLRIKVFTSDLNNTALYCNTVGQMVTDFTSTSTTVVCEASDILTAAARTLLLETLLPAAAQLHTERLMVEPVARLQLSSPFGDFDTVCRRYAVPQEHFTTGVADADFVLYVSATPMTGQAAGTAAFAKTCQTDANGRPVAGVLNIAPGYLFPSDYRADGSDANAQQTDTTIRHAIRNLAHEMLHALGFDYNRFASTGMIGIANLRSKVNVRGVNSPQTLRHAREHYGCSSLRLMELEDYDVVGSTSSHWKMRNAKDELMSSYTQSAGLYTAMTIGAMEDLGFYKGNYAMAENMSWGNGAGCTLVNNKCLINGGIVVSQSNPNTADMFCNTPLSEAVAVSNAASCTSSRLALGTCNLVTRTQRYPFYAQYFDDQYTGGTESAMDFCPFTEEMTEMSCATGSEAAMPGSVISSAARCLDVSAESSQGILIKDKRVPVFDLINEEVSFVSAQPRAVCVDVLCDAQQQTYQIRVRGAERFVDCPIGGTVTPSAFSSQVFTNGTLDCPPYMQVCGLSSDSKDAFGNGRDELRNDYGDGAAPALLHLGLVQVIVLLLVATTTLIA